MKEKGEGRQVKAGRQKGRPVKESDRPQKGRQAGRKTKAGEGTQVKEGKDRRPAPTTLRHIKRPSHARITPS